MNIIKNVIPSLVFEKMKTVVLGPDIPWNYVSTDYQNIDNGSLYDKSWQHNVMAFGNAVSPLSDLLETAVLTALDKVNESVTKILRIRLTLQTVTAIPCINLPHVDLFEPHKAGIIYMLNSDGPTIFYNEMFDPNYKLQPFDFYKNILKEKVTIFDEVVPEENLMVLFNGHQFHNGTTPTTVSRRVLLNFNYR
jgi:hypothetical protein